MPPIAIQSCRSSLKSSTVSLSYRPSSECAQFLATTAPKPYQQHSSELQHRVSLENYAAVDLTQKTQFSYPNPTLLDPVALVIDNPTTIAKEVTEQRKGN